MTIWQQQLRKTHIRKWTAMVKFKRIVIIKIRKMKVLNCRMVLDLERNCFNEKSIYD
jgi:hypothetical protein